MMGEPWKGSPQAGLCSAICEVSSIVEEVMLTSLQDHGCVTASPWQDLTGR